METETIITDKKGSYRDSVATISREGKRNFINPKQPKGRLYNLRTWFSIFYLIVFFIVNAYFLVKIFLYKILGSVFSQREKTGELVFNMMLYHNVLGMILLPLSTIHSVLPGFGPFSLFIVPGLIAVFYLLSVTRSIYFAIREGISIFYLILYLCALEILPILLVVKLAING